ncbi:MAG: DUF3784 domain-containing protein [Candidatus Dadabacteria bacterium]|nr:DUF3784 domain-containing protein [Candidatus Dadabacteria bacterium]NIS08772.1 DUF3784 domain-containing protein [Candidatus Dadabacteria bacterium]NIV42715.1 DUF3784 domain-containing protein [Candidatus Dadabacteria bacterium]NIX15458.1 DUF3784 domain-containing protein [Candidatus Dadabacteria bacterium]NIY22120.1 DUF3784 domain-containing protein [Candidatus Dadabacteria bacterium]
MTSLIEIAQNDRNLIIIAGFALSSIFIILGILIGRRKYYNLIAGYNLEPKHIKEQYDIEGLAKHIGDGLITLGVLLIICAIFLYFNFLKLLIAAIFIFLFIVLIILLGSRKFMPYTQNLMKESPSDARHHFLHWLLPERIFRALEKGSRKWLQECRHCGYKQDYWEAGNVRYKAIGEPTQLQYCENCKKFRMHKIRKKTILEADRIVNEIIKTNS